LQLSSAPKANAAIDELHKNGNRSRHAHRDSQAVAKAVANQLGNRRVFGEVLPEHKDQKVSELQRLGKRVAMVGDGVNDAPALTRAADVGIAIGAARTWQSNRRASVLVHSNPLDVVKIFKLSRASYNKMIQNLWWAAGINIVAIPLAAGVLVNLGYPALACNRRGCSCPQHHCSGDQRPVAEKDNNIRPFSRAH